VWALLLASGCSSSTSSNSAATPNSTTLANQALGDGTLQVVATQVICGGAQEVGAPVCRSSATLSGAQVSIAQNGSVISVLTTDSSGTGSATLASGQYQVSLFKCPPYDSCPSVSIIVAGSSVQATVQEIIDAP
jgi:hypothetical protein